LGAAANHPEEGNVQAFEEVAMSADVIDCVRVEALFVSAVQPSDAVNCEQVRTAVRQAVREHGSRGCAALVAYEFGEHPDTAVARMQWASGVVESTFHPNGTAPSGIRAVLRMPAQEAA
jgi:hypothetical protein